MMKIAKILRMNMQFLYTTALLRLGFLAYLDDKWLEVKKTRNFSLK